MRRADRLFQIIQLLRRRRVTTAQQLAERLEVSERTIYRDVRDLVAAGTPIDGEAGVGYTLGKGYDLPPLMFDREEIEALSLGARIVESFADVELARAARTALSKVESVLPDSLKGQTQRSRLFSPDLGRGRALSQSLLPIRTAVSQQRKVRIRYARADGKRSMRTIRPLATFFWGASWTVAAYCEVRQDFRSFRLDRIAKLEVLTQTFEAEAGTRLEDFLAGLGGGAERLLER